MANNQVYDVDIEQISQASNYLKTLLNKPDISDWFLEKKNVYRSFGLMELYRDLKGLSGKVSSYKELLQAFRLFKQRHFCRIASREFFGLAGFEETVSQISYLAQVCLQAGIEMLKDNPSWWMKKQHLDQKDLLPGDADLVVLGMGKLGGEELNYVSDIDLIYLHGLDESDLSSDRIQEKKDCLRKMCQYLTGLLHEFVQGDRVFLVDLRLRPKGKDGELVPSANGALKHYQIYGRAWERQALLKANPVAGNRSLGKSFLQEIHPFVFRRFLDFQALDEIRKMRDDILKEEQTLYSSGPMDIKLGVGGIREIEFIVQSFQLIYGGRYFELANSNTLKCLDALLDMGLVPENAVQELKQAYIFLRRVEHWIQLEQNRQAHKLPETEQGLQRLAWILGYAEDTPSFTRDLESCTARVHEHFLELFKSGQKQGNGEYKDSEEAENSRDREEQDQNIFHSPEIAENFDPSLIRAVREVLEYCQEQGIIRDFSNGAARMENFLYRIKTKPGLAKLLNSLPSWHKILLQGLVQSEFIASLLSYQPALMEGIPESGTFNPFEDWKKRAEKIIQGAQTFEEILEWIRRLKNERMLVLALSDLFGGSPFAGGQAIRREEIERELSLLADFIVGHTFVQVCRMLGEDENVPLSVFALGKLGSMEMSYLSDLDLMFVYEPREDEQKDQIPKNIIRLIQRFMRMLSTPLQEGPGYSVDARLRPTGNYGPLTVTRQRWEEYYEQEADNWEVQALLRIRRVAGDPVLGEYIENAASGICFVSRDPSVVWPEICDMRRRILEERSTDKQGEFDLKTGSGGIIELEFLVQGMQLVIGHGCSGIRQGKVQDGLPLALAGMDDLVPGTEFSGKEKVELITWIFGIYRMLEHHLQLLSNSGSARVTEFGLQNLLQNRAASCGEGSLPAGLETWSDLQRMRRQVSSLWQGLCSNYA